MKNTSPLRKKLSAAKRGFFAPAVKHGFFLRPLFYSKGTLRKGRFCVLEAVSDSRNSTCLCIGSFLR
jgi:hypothetical protein